MDELTNAWVLVTRPGQQGKELCAMIAARGINALHFPTIEFSPAKSEPLQQQIAQLSEYNWLIFISPQAVASSIDLIQQAWPVLPKSIRIAAPGAGTAEALRAAGLNEVIYPAQEWSSEGLLNIPAFQDVARQKILIVRGAGGRELLAETLAARGACVEHLIAYRRVLPAAPDRDEYLNLLREQKIAIIVCTSGEGLHNLLTITGAEHQAELLAVPLLVVSQRLIALAKELHFQRSFLAANASHSAIMDAIGKCHGK